QVAMAVGRHSEQPADERDRVRLRKVVEQVEAAALLTHVEKLVRELSGGLAHPLDCARRERGCDELANARVVRRLDEEKAPALDAPEALPARIERRRVDLLFAADVPEVTPQAAIAQACAHLGVPGDEVPAESLVVMDGARLAERGER